MAEPLASWNDGPTKNAVLAFVERVSAENKPILRLLVLHDDGEREFDYTSGAEQALEKADADGWFLISVKDDWSTVFADASQ